MATASARHPLTDLALAELTGAGKDQCASATSTYLDSLQNIGVIRGKLYPYQTDSCLIAPIFNSISRNRYPLVSPYKLAVSDWNESKSPRDTIFATTDFVGNHEDANVQMQTNSTHIRPINLLTSKNRSVVSYDGDEVLEYNGYFIAFHVAPGSTVAGVTMHYGRTPGFCAVEPELADSVKARPTYAQYSSAPLKFSSVFTPTNRATTIPANSPAGLYLYNVRKVPARVSRGSKLGATTTDAQVFGYSVQEELLYMSSHNAEPVILFSFNDPLDTGYGYEDEFNLANIESLKVTASKLRELSRSRPAPIKATDQLQLISAALNIQTSSSKFKVPNSFNGQFSSLPNTIDASVIQNFYSGFSRLGLNKSILNYYQNFLSGPKKGLSHFTRNHTQAKRPADLKPFELSNAATAREANARFALDNLCLAEDVRAPFSASSYRQLLLRQTSTPENYPLNTLSHRLNNSNFVMPWSPSGPVVKGDPVSLSIGKIYKDEQLMRGSYKFFGAGTGINTRAKAIDFMKSTFTFLQSVPRL